MNEPRPPQQSGEAREAGAAGQPEKPDSREPVSPARPPESARGGDQTSPDRYAEARQQMVERQIVARGITDPLVIRAMRRVPRHEFVPASERRFAYDDTPLPIGHRQTISQPYIVALMTQTLALKPGDRVLDIGTGSGYQAAVLAEIVEHVWTIEIVEPLGVAARERLERLGYDNVTARVGDGFQGWEEHAPFDAILLAAAPEKIPPPLLEQLAPGGRLVLPVGGAESQMLLLVKKDADGNISQSRIAAVRFVPMTGEAEDDNGGK